MSCIDKNFLLSQLAKIETQAHPIYALIAGLPKANFHLFRDYEQARSVEHLPGDDKNTFSIREFLSRVNDFHAEDEFSLYFIVQLDRIPAVLAQQYTDRIRLDTRVQVTPARLTKSTTGFLESFCEKCLRENRPFELTPELVARYGFTQEDVTALSKPLTRYNARARKQIRAEYTALKKLDFIKERA